jgi:3-oxoadipate enol-lactonase
MPSKSDRTPLVLLHAGIADNRMWGPILPRLESARRVLAPDLRGYGTRPLEKEPFSYVDDVVALLDAEGIDRAVLVGASNGGRISINVALEHPDRMAALVLAAPALDGWAFSEETRAFGAQEDELLEIGRVDAAVDLNVRTWVDGRGRGPDDVDPGIRELVREMQALAFHHVLNAYSTEPHPEERGLDPPAADRLAELTPPTLIVVGDRDLPDFPRIAARIAEEARNARVIEISDVAHLISMERPELFAELVISYLDEIGV